MAIHSFCNNDTFLKTMYYLTPQDIWHVGGVCRSWQERLNQVMCTLHKAYELPEVEGGEYTLRNFVALAATGLNVKQIRALYSKYIGEPVGETPFVTKAQIKQLCDPDQPGKRNFEMYKGIILFPAVKRTFGRGETATLDEENRLTITEIMDDVDSEEKELTIPMSIYNAIELFKHPKTGTENGPIFQKILNEINQCTTCLEIPSIVFMRPQVSEGLLRGAPAAGFLPLMIANGFNILETGTCFYVPTGTHQFTYVRTSDAIVTHGRSYQLAFWDFVHGVGVEVNHFDGDHVFDDILGALPMIPMEVRLLDL